MSVCSVAPILSRLERYASNPSYEISSSKPKELSLCAHRTSKWRKLRIWMCLPIISFDQRLRIRYVLRRKVRLGVCIEMHVSSYSIKVDNQHALSMNVIKWEKLQGSESSRNPTFVMRFVIRNRSNGSTRRKSTYGPCEAKAVSLLSQVLRWYERALPRANLQQRLRLVW